MIPLRHLVAAFFVAGALPASGAEATQAESDQAFRIFLNVKEHLVEECVYQPTALAVLTGTLKALERELDPEFAPYFPQQLPADFPKAFDRAQKSLRKLAAQPEMGTRTLQSLVEQGLRGYCRTLDRYSEYEDLAASEMERKLKSPAYVGVGMTLERNDLGFDLFPFPSGPADLAGIFPGDRLLEVDGRSVRGLGRLEAGAMFPGSLGTTVKVKVRRISGDKQEVVAIKRGNIAPESISVEQESTGPVVRLRRLVPATLDELRTFLRTARPGTPLTLDLRGCPGGEFKVAVAIAELFLPAKATICRLETRVRSETFPSANPSPFVAKPLIILQNRGTMSGAELITIALSASPAVRAETRGERSYGKGVTLSVNVIENGGGQLRFADGRLLGPDGQTWDGEGLPPTVEDLRKP